MEGNKARAPYNFVPFSEKLLIRYENHGELPRHDRIDPALHSGEIQAELKAETPVFVSDGQQDPPLFPGAGRDLPDPRLHRAGSGAGEYADFRLWPGAPGGGPGRRADLFPGHSGRPKERSRSA